MTSGRHPVALALVLVLAAPARQAASTQPGDPRGQADGIARLITRLEQALAAGDRAALSAVFASSAPPQVVERFAANATLAGATRAVVVERDRRAFSSAAVRLILEVFVEAGMAARVATWRVDIRRAPDVRDADGTDLWQITDHERLSSVDGLYRLALNPSRQFQARNLTIVAEDLTLRFDGTVYQADVDEGVTALLLLGAGTMEFRPTPATERGQVRIFAGSETLKTPFNAGFLRLHPAELDDRISTGTLGPEPVDPRTFRRAEQIFREEVGKSFGIDLAGLSPHVWSLVPPYGDFLAEVRTRRFGTLTYAKSSSEAEDISLFIREKRKNIAMYASRDKLVRRGRFYDEDELADYDVIEYAIDATFVPDRTRIDGEARLRIRVRAQALTTLTLRLAESLVARSVTADQLGPLLHFRVRSQNSLIVNLPVTLPRDTVLDLRVRYGGTLPPQELEREALALAPAQRMQPEPIDISLEQTWAYSTRSYWYPQAQVTDYATATLTVTVPAWYDCVASGELTSGAPGLVPAGGGAPERKRYVFAALQPLRYLAVLITRLVPVSSNVVSLEAALKRSTGTPGERGEPAPAPEVQDTGRGVGAGVFYQSVDLTLRANPRLVERGRELFPRIAHMVQFYTSLVGDCPYPALSVALLESSLPGGHSPAYLAAINEPTIFAPRVWRNDPAAFQNYPEFFVAHEVAHQWWGQAIGWKNYHEQWLSEGIAQYFAALYARELRGERVFTGILARLRRFALDASDQGPVYLGYRLGHIRDDGQVFRSLVYNKGAASLHMLRRLLGDEPFFRGLRRFYVTWRFRKAGTDDLRRAFEAESGRSLDRFFERWIYGSSVPRLRFSHALSADHRSVTLRFEQLGDRPGDAPPLFDVPVTVTLVYQDGREQDLVVAVTERVIQREAPLGGSLRRVDVNRDGAALAEIER